MTSSVFLMPLLSLLVIESISHKCIATFWLNAIASYFSFSTKVHLNSNFKFY